MTGFDDLLAALKEQQDDLDAARRRLWPRFTEFRNGLIEGLRTFANGAVNSGMRGVKRAEDIPISESIKETSLMLNYCEIRVLYPCELIQPPSRFEHIVRTAVEPDPDKISGGLPTVRIWVFAGPEGDAGPYGHIDTGYSRERAFYYEIYAVTETNQPALLTRGQDLQKQTGEQAAAWLIRHFYSSEAGQVP